MVDPFTTSGAASFLENSGLKLKNEQIKAILTEASLYEKTKGFVRPITLNMIGLALNRISVPRQAVAIHGFDAGGILMKYTTESLDRSDPNGFAKIVMKYMLSADGTKIPQTIDQLHEKTRLKPGTIESLMLNCKKDGLVRMLDESRRLWEISHDFVANLIAKAVGRDDRTFFQKARPWLLTFLLMGWVTLATILFWWPDSMSFKEIIEDMDANYSQAYSPNNYQLDLNNLYVRDGDITRLMEMEEAKKLVSLLMANALITDAGMEQIKDLPLNTLDLSSCYSITDAGLEQLKGLKQLNTLNLTGCNNITDVGLEHLKGLKQLNTLSLSGCDKITNAGLQQIKDLPLNTLDLSSCFNITDAGLEQLKGLKQLNTLNLSSSFDLTGTCLEHLKNLPLKMLYLSGWFKINEASLVHLKELKQLNTLDLSYSDITSKSMKYLTDLPLKSLFLNDCGNIIDADLEHLKGLPLNNLDLSSCSKITDLGLVHLKGLKQLNNLALSYIDNITDAGLEHIRNLPLSILDLSYCDNITDTGLEHIKNMSLVQLKLSWCDNITDVGLACLKDMPLKRLELQFCDQITKEGVQNFKAQCKYSEVEVVGP